LFDLIKNVIFSWQVIAVAVAFIIWCVLLSLIEKPVKIPRRKVKPGKVKRPKEESPALPPNVDTKELGLEAG